jgi:hypothetical protein
MNVFGDGDGLPEPNFDVVVHVGFPKTGSSTLQKALFGPLSDEGIIRLFTWRQNNDSEPLEERPSSRLFNGLPILESYLSFSKSTTNVISDESFTAPVKLRRHNFGAGIASPWTFPLEIKRQIRDRWGLEARLIWLVVFRNQAELIYSQYVEEFNLKRRGVDILFDENGGLSLDGYDIYRFGDYLELLNEVSSGTDKVVPLFYEELREDSAKFSDRLASACGFSFDRVKDVMANARNNERQKTSKGYFTADKRQIIPFLSELHQGEIRSTFSGDSKKLQSLVGPDFPLRQWGYF